MPPQLDHAFGFQILEGLRESRDRLIDHLLESEALVGADRQLGPAMGSDHFPLVVDLQLASE